MKVEVNPLSCEPDCKLHEGMHPVADICPHITLTNAKFIDESDTHNYDVFDGLWIHCITCDIEYYLELARYYD